MNSKNKRGFTLIELLVVVGMIALILGAVTTAVTSAQERARVQKATSEVKAITQAILAYENYSRGGKFELKAMGGIGINGVYADAEHLGFLLGNKENAESGGKIPALLMASLKAGGQMIDPWGTPYRVHIAEGKGDVYSKVASGSIQSGYFLPNFYRLGKGERDL